MTRAGLLCGFLLPFHFVIACGSGNSDAVDAGGDGGRDALRGTVVRDAATDAATEARAGQVAPQLVSANAWRSGQVGDGVGVTLEGADPNGDVVRIGIRFLDGEGQPLACFDSDADGVPDSSEGSGRIDTPVGNKPSFVGTAWFPGILQWCPDAVRYQLWLEDAAGLSSAEIESDVMEQVELGAGAECNPTLLGSRCAEGWACMGEPPVCAATVAPGLTRLAYLQVSGAVRIAAEGTDPAQLLSRLTLDFLDGSGGPVSVDQDGDGTGDGASMDASCVDASRGGVFALNWSPTGAFAATVKRLVATPAGGGLVGAAMDAKLTPVTTRGSGAACDYAGFDTCGTGSVCYPGIKGKVNTCVGLGAARAKQQTGISVLSPTSKLRAAGVALGTSLWEAPAGCQPGDPEGMPEGVMLLHLVAPQPQLIVTTELPGTDFDSAVYVIKNYAAATPTVLGCNDDGPAAPTSTLTLQNLAAGDYLIVVDSFRPRGGNFEVRIIPGS